MFNPLLALARWLQDTTLRLDLSQSIWAVPIIGAIHVLAIAWFAGAVLVRDPQLRRFRWTGLSILLFTGALLFWSQPLRVSSLTSMTSPLVYSYGDDVHSAQTSWP